MWCGDLLADHPQRSRSSVPRCLYLDGFTSNSGDKVKEMGRWRKIVMKRKDGEGEVFEC